MGGRDPVDGRAIGGGAEAESSVGLDEGADRGSGQGGHGQVPVAGEVGEVTQSHGPLAPLVTAAYGHISALDGVVNLQRAKHSCCC